MPPPCDCCSMSAMKHIVSRSTIIISCGGRSIRSEIRTRGYPGRSNVPLPTNNTRWGQVMDPWRLIERGRFHEAVDALTEQLRQDKSGPNYFNRGIAYLNLGQHERAMTDFAAANE